MRVVHTCVRAAPGGRQGKCLNQADQKAFELQNENCSKPYGLHSFVTDHRQRLALLLMFAITGDGAFTCWYWRVDYFSAILLPPTAPPAPPTKEPTAIPTAVPPPGSIAEPMIPPIFAPAADPAAAPAQAPPSTAAASTR
jgi:hypothetical protein